MEKLFGLDMNMVAGCLGSVVALVLAGLAALAWRGRVMLKLGLRPIPRRRAQSALIVLGLMLATLIITAAFVTGDTLSHTIRSLVVDELGEADEVVVAGGSNTYFKVARYQELAAQLADYPGIDHLVPAISENIPVINTTQRQSVRGLNVLAFQPEDVGLIPDRMVDAQGNTLSLADLGEQEVYLNAAAAKALNAAPGDRLALYASTASTEMRVRAVAASPNTGQRLFLSLRQAQALFDQRGKINAIFVSNAGDALQGATHSQEVTTHLRGLLTDTLVATRICDLLTGDATAVQAVRQAAATREGNLQKDLQTLADELETRQGAPGAALRSLLADTNLAAQFQAILADANWRSKTARDRLAILFGDLSDLTVNDVKRDNLDQGELAANVFTTIFVVTGLFSIAAGMLLIFLIFVMLAAERKSEMGMTRAIGAQRSHLVEMFVFEGAAYDLVSAAVGVALGVGVGLVIAVTLGQLFSGTDLTIKPNVTLRSLSISYALGMLVTFSTVVFSAYRVSHLNIVAAIRDLPEPPPAPVRLRDRLWAPFRTMGQGFRLLFKLRVFQALWAWWVGVPLSFLRLIWSGFTGGPFTFLLGLLIFVSAFQSLSASGFFLGGSLLIVGGGLMLRGLLHGILRHRPELAERITFTIMGLGLTIFWALPSEVWDALGAKNFQGGGLEMFFFCGIFLVAGAVLVVMYNTDLLLHALISVLAGARHLVPVLQMAIAYPLSNRFRTGLTIGMFAVVVFSVVFMAAAFKTNEMFFADTAALTGGFNLRAETSYTNPVANLAKAVKTNPRLRAADYAVVAAQSSLSTDVRQAGERWSGYQLHGVDDAYLNNVGYEFAIMAEGYHSAAEVWRAVRDNPGYAVIDSYAVPSRETTSIVIGGPEFKIKGLYLEDKVMPPLTLQVREASSKAAFEVTIIGVLKSTAFYSFGIYTSQATLERSVPFQVSPTTYYIRLDDGASPEQAGAALESAFLKNGLQSIDQVAEVKKQQSSQVVVEQLLQGFLMLGLVVGVAALGVISTRSVVERRQQIGMLRALGFRREMVAWSFLIESSFVALLGIGLGVGLALIPAYQMIQDMAKDMPGLHFQVPWDIISVVVVVAYGMALLTTWLPARQASRVAPAEALRYE